MGFPALPLPGSPLSLLSAHSNGVPRPAIPRLPPPLSRGLLGLFGALLGYLKLSGTLCEFSWGYLGLLWSPLGPSWAPLELLLGSPGAVWAPSWALLGVSWAFLQPSKIGT